MLNLFKYLYRSLYWGAEPLNSDSYPPKDVYYNVNGGDNNKRALVLWVAEPFSPGFLHSNLARHSNLRRACILVDILGSLGFSVDVTDWMNPAPPQSKEYQVIIGQGIAFERVCQASKLGVTKIFLATGADNSQAIRGERRRLRSFGLRTGIVGKLRYRRRTDKGPCCADFIFVNGNEWVSSTYRTKTRAPLSLIANCDVFNAPKIYSLPLQNRDSREFLWFASFGAIHRGLDLLIEIFSDRPDLTLHVVGGIEHEQEFWLAYTDILCRCTNIKFYGFLDISGKVFSGILAKSSAHLFLSASDGSPGAVVTTMQAGLIPIVTRESGIDVSVDGIVLKNVWKGTILQAVNAVSNMTPSELRTRGDRIAEYALKSFNEQRFEETVRGALVKALV
ncbi:MULTISPECIES: glycosyltransferase [Aphanothece]|uniref:glycosyltransferase n=1 Tax=Aphanothece TaxID=1121 RepID=UPI00398F298C